MKSLLQYINESLIKSYNASDLVKKLSKEMGIPEKYFQYDKKSKNAQAIKLRYYYEKEYPEDVKDNLSKIKEWHGDDYIPEKINDILKFYGYYTIRIDHGTSYDSNPNTEWWIEPIFGKNITDWIYDDCKGDIYVIISNRKMSAISKGGIKTNFEEYQKQLFKGDKKEAQKARLNDKVQSTYGGNHYSRVYFFAGSTEEGLCSAFLEAAMELGIYPKDFKDNEYKVIHINLKKSKLNVDCYEDSYDRIKKYKHKDGNLLYINGSFKPNTFEDIKSIKDFLYEFKEVKIADDIIQKIEKKR